MEGQGIGSKADEGQVLRQKLRIQRLVCRIITNSILGIGVPVML